MTSRTRTAKKTTSQSAEPAAKRTTKKTTAKRTPARKTTPRKTAAATTPALTLVKPGDQQPTHKATIVDLRHPLTVRRRRFVGPWGPSEQAAIRAALDSAALQLPIPVRTWNGSTAKLKDNTLLVHNPGPDRVFTAHTTCRNGAIHGTPITSWQDLTDARTQADTCTLTHAQPTPDPDGIHTELDWATAITRGVTPAPQPKPAAAFPLPEGVRRTEATKHDTQPMPLDTIAEGLAERAAAKTQEIPQP